MYNVKLLEQYGARPPQTRKTIEWQDGSVCTARTLITEHVRAIHDAYMVRLDPDGTVPAELMIYQAPHEIARDLSFDRLLENAVKAFEERQIIMIANGRQIDALDEEVDLRPETQVVFLKIIPLKGG